MVSGLIASLSAGDHKALMAHLVQEGDTAPGDLGQLRRKLGNGKSHHSPPLTMLPSAVPGTNSVRAMFSVPAATSSDIEYKAKTATDARQVATIEQSLRSAANIDSALIDDAPARAFRHGRFHAY